MTDQQPQAGRAPVGAVLTFIAAAILYAAMMASMSDLHDSDAAGRGMAAAFGAMFGIALWLAIAVLLLIAFINGRMPRWAAASMLILHPLAGVAAIAAANLHAAQGGWPIYVAAILPPLVGIYALAMRVPVALPVKLISVAVAGLVLLLSLTPLTISFVAQHPSEAQQAKIRADEQAQQDARDREDRQARENELAAFKRLNPDSSLRDYLTYLAGGDAHYREALAGARLVKSRQTDAVTLLRQGHIAELQDLLNLDLASTAELCAAYDFALRVEAMKVQRGRGAWLTAAMDLEWQLPNITWLAGAGCNLDPSLTLLETNVRAVSDSPRLDKFADKLHSFRRTP